MKSKTKQLWLKALLLTIFIPRARQLYRDVNEHTNKIINLAGNDQRIKNAPNLNKFFISFWIRFKTKTYIRRASAVDKFVSSVNSATDDCSVKDPGAWVFFVLPYTIEKTSSTSFKLHPLSSQRQQTPGHQTCLTSSDTACVCSGRPFQDLDSVFGNSVVVVPSAGSHQFSLSSFDGTSGKPELRTLMSGLVTFTAHNLVSHQVMAELMKGQSSNLFSVDLHNIDYNIILPYLGSLTPDTAYLRSSYGGLRLKHGEYLDLKRQKIYSDSTDPKKLTKNFCWHFLVRSNQKPDTVDRELKVRLQLTTPTTPPNHIVQEEIILQFYLNGDPVTNPNKMESYISMSAGQTPVKFYEKTNLYLASQKEVEITTCYSKLFLSETAIVHAIYLEMVEKDSLTPASIVQETVMRDFLVETGISPAIDTQNDFRDFKFLADSHRSDWSIDYSAIFSDFKVMDGGMIEHAEASQHVNSVGAEGAISNCLLEVDSEQKKCLNCDVTRFFDESSGKCLACHTMIQNCNTCHKLGFCDTCFKYSTPFGATSCLLDLADCVAPKYSRFLDYRCDSCEHSPPNTCKCGDKWNLVDSSLGGGRKMCSCKIQNCKV